MKIGSVINALIIAVNNIGVFIDRSDTYAIKIVEITFMIKPKIKKPLILSPFSYNRLR
jgi:hypothetical protein